MIAGLDWFAVAVLVSGALLLAFALRPLVAAALWRWWQARAWRLDVARGPAQWERLREQLRAKPAEGVANCNTDAAPPVGGATASRPMWMGVPPAESAPARDTSVPRPAEDRPKTLLDLLVEAGGGRRPRLTEREEAVLRERFEATARRVTPWAVLPGFWPALPASLFDPTAGEDACGHRHDRWTCTRERGHRGAHVAHTKTSSEECPVSVVACWDDVTREVRS